MTTVRSICDCFWHLHTGTLYDTVAGVDTYVHLQLKDKYNNNLLIGGGVIELALLGVAGKTCFVAIENGPVNDYFLYY